MPFTIVDHTDTPPAWFHGTTATAIQAAADKYGWATERFHVSATYRRGNEQVFLEYTIRGGVSIASGPRGRILGQNKARQVIAALSTIPADYPAQPLTPDAPARVRATCGECGRSWDDGVSTALTPTPAGRCPFETWH